MKLPTGLAWVVAWWKLHSFPSPSETALEALHASTANIVVQASKLIRSTTQRTRRRQQATVGDGISEIAGDEL